MRTTLALLVILAACGGPPQAAREAQRRLEAGDLAGAEQLTTQGLQEHPKEPLLWNVKIRILLARSDSAGAVALYRQWRQLHGGDDGSALRGMALTTLWQALKSPSPDIRVQAIRAIERLDESRLAEPVAERMGDDDEEVAAVAAGALVRSHPDAPTVLVQSLKSTKPAARIAALEALGRKVGKEAHAEIAPSLADPDAGVREAAVEALAAAGSDDDVARLVEMVKSDPSGPVRASALRTLGRLKAFAVVDTARAAVNDKYLGARLAAVEVLAAADVAPQELERVAVVDPFVALRVSVLMAKKGVPSFGAKVVQTGLAAKEWGLRAAALNALAEIMPGPAGVQLARGLVGDPEPAVRLGAGRALLRLGQKDEARAVFTAGLAFPEELRLQAALDLIRAGDPQGLTALGTLASSAENQAVRQSAVSSLPTHDASLDALVGALADAAGNVRVAAAERLLASQL